MFTDQFLSILSLHRHPGQPDDHQILPELFPGEMKLGISGTEVGRDTAQWEEVELGNSLSRKSDALTFFACSVPKRLEDRHIPPSPIFEKTQVLGGKTSTYSTMKKLEFTLLWSPPVTSPTYAHEAFQYSTQIQIGGQGSSGIWRKSYESQRQKQASRENRDYAANRRKQNKINHKTNKNINILSEKLLYPLKKNRMLWKIKILRELKYKTL